MSVKGCIVVAWNELGFVRLCFVAGWSSLVARRAHNPKVVSSNLAPATKYVTVDIEYLASTASVEWY